MVRYTSSKLDRGRDMRSVERKQKTENHPNIEFLEDGLFRVDRVHISDVGNAIITIITN